MKKKLTRMIFASILAALGLVIALYMPKIVIGDASYTLASHVPIFIAMFIGPDVSFFVGLATGLGFFSLTPIIAVRALSHLIWAVPGSILIRKYKQNTKMLVFFNLIIAAIHALLEILVVLPFYDLKVTEFSWIVSAIFIPIGLGGMIHSILDFSIGILIYKRIEDNMTSIL